MNKYGIYKLTSPNGKCYIGRASNIYSRLNKYKNNHNKEQILISNAIKKYGWCNFKIDILWFTEDNTNINHILNELEIDFINLYDCISPNGYNLKGGGNGYNVSEETKNKLSIKSKENANKRSKEQLLKFIEGGKKTRFKNGHKLSYEHINYLKNNVKPINQYTLNNIFIKKWNSIKEASENLNIQRTSISKNLNNVYKKAGMFIFKYENK